MKKTVFRYGLLGGLIVGAVLAGATLYGVYTRHFEGSMVLGFGSMILAFSLIFVALKQLRDKQYNGVISFGKAFKAAILITLITSTIYVVVWSVCYNFFIPDFMNEYTTHALNQAKEKGATPAELAEETAKMQQTADMYKNPLFFVLLTYMEIFPVGIVVSLVAALIIKRKKALHHDAFYATGGA